MSEHFVFSNKEGTATYNFRSTSSWCVLLIALLVTFHPFHCILVPECMPVAWIGSLLATNKLSYLVFHSKDAPQINRAHVRTCTHTHTRQGTVAAKIMAHMSQNLVETKVSKNLTPLTNILIEVVCFVFSDGSFFVDKKHGPLAS